MGEIGERRARVAMAGAARVFCRTAQPSGHQAIRAGSAKNSEYRQHNVIHDFETLTIATQHC